MEQELVSIRAACAMLSLGRTTIYGLIAEGRLERISIGRRSLITVSSIKRLATAPTVVGTTGDAR